MRRLSRLTICIAKGCPIEAKIAYRTSLNDSGSDQADSRQSIRSTASTRNCTEWDAPARPRTGDTIRLREHLRDETA